MELGDVRCFYSPSRDELASTIISKARFVLEQLIRNSGVVLVAWNAPWATFPKLNPSG
ncbi:MAG: hypothetical protein IPO07_31490 [Haliscomenobacter sp.]|nr:hypothetical protein [Haliscomenobacter sp.]MBK9492801.1 hypothetical protein [Haliscomenobacter sp.]